MKNSHSGKEKIIIVGFRIDNKNGSLFFLYSFCIFFLYYCDCVSFQSFTFIYMYLPNIITETYQLYGI